MTEDVQPETNRCPSCGSSREAGARSCAVCGETESWRATRRGIIIESGLVVLLVAVAASGLLWWRQRDTESVSPQVRILEQSVVEEVPTDVATFTPPPAPTRTQVPNTPYPPTETPMPATVTHVVASGDTLFGIAIQYGVTVDTIVSFNQLPNQHSLSIGQELAIPLSGAAAAESPDEEVAAEPVAEAETEDEADESEENGGAGDGDSADEASSEEERAEAPEGEDAPEAAVEPAAAGEPVVVREAEIYRVQPGDTPLGIALAHDISLDELLEYNGLNSDNPPLSIGQSLVVKPAEVARATAAPAVVPADPVKVTAPKTAVLTPGQFPAPRPLGPGRSAVLDVDEPLLRWSSVGVLPKGVYYAVAVRDITKVLENRQDGTPPPDLAQLLAEDAELHWVFSNATALRYRPGFRAGLRGSRTFAWTVTVRRQDEALGAGGELLSPIDGSMVRTFTWSSGRKGSTETN